MNIFMFCDMDSFLHKLDPRTKLIALLAFFTYAVVFHSIVVQLIVFLMVLLYATLGRTLGNVLRARGLLFSLFILSTLMWVLTMRGATKIIWWLSFEGLLYGMSKGISLAIMVIASITLITTTKAEELTIAFLRMGLPYRIAFAISTAIRMIPSIANTGAIILQAQASRGLDTETGNNIQRIKKYIPIIVPTIISVIRGTSILTMALVSKGFVYSDKRVNYITISYKPLDYILSFVLLLSTILSICIKICFDLH